MMQRFTSFWRRNSTTIGMTIIVCAFMAILYLQALATSKLREQVVVQKQIISKVQGVAQQINDSSKISTQQIDLLNKHLDCIVVFFTQSDRSQKSIKDIDNCTFKSVSASYFSAQKDAVNN